MAQSATVTMIAGGAGEIGHALAAELLRRGHRLCLTDLERDALEEACDRSGLRGDPRVSLFSLDVRHPDEWRACLDEVIDRHGRLDVLYNVAGFIRAQNLLQADDRDVEMHFAVNAVGVAHGTRLAASHMVRQGHGHIVNMASLMGIAPVPGFSLYSDSKSAARGLSVCAAQELLPHGVYVTVVCPDTVNTNKLDAELHRDTATFAFAGRPLSVEEVVEVLSGKVLNDKPVEVTLTPPHSGRAALSKLAAMAPGLALPLGPLFASMGTRVLGRRRRTHTGGAIE